MMLVSAKGYPPLLWGMFILFAADSMAASTPEIDNNTPTAEPRKTTTTTTALGFQNKTDSHAAAWDSTHEPAIATISEAAKSTVVTTVETKGTVISNKNNSSDDSTVALLLTSTAAAAAAAASPSSSTPQLLHTSTAASETQPSHHTSVKETATPTRDLSHRQSTAASTNTAAPATTSAAFSPAATVPQPTSITKSEMTSASSSTFSSEKSTADASFQNLTSTSVSTMSPMTAEPISETTHGSTFLPPTTAETSRTRTESSSTAQPVTASSSPVSTSLFSNTTESNATSISTESPNSTTAAGFLKPRKPKLPPVATSRSAPATESPHDEVLKTTPSIEVQPCLTPSVVKQCFIIIAFLAVLATIFIFSTIVLCVKLSVRKHRRKPQTETEMMCISALLPERSHNYTRQHSRVPNGVLVFPRLEDSDEEVGDNLTLSSFLPENDRYV